MAEPLPVPEADLSTRPQAFWDNLLGNNYEADHVMQQAALGKGKRARKEVHCFSLQSSSRAA